MDFFGKSSRSPSERRELLIQRKKLSEEGKKYSKQNLDYDYFDNPDNPTGYGGYNYDGRFEIPVDKMIKYYQLEKGSKIFELGPAKGFVLAEFSKMEMSVFGQDASKYAIKNCHDLLIGRILNVLAPEFPWPNQYFDLVIAKDILPHLPPHLIDATLQGLQRISKGNIFFDIECGRTEWEKIALNEWDETHLICESPEWWMDKLLQNNIKAQTNFKVLVSEVGFEDHVTI